MPKPQAMVSDTPTARKTHTSLYLLFEAMKTTPHKEQMPKPTTPSQRNIKIKKRIQVGIFFP
jgi:hypothetical protein